MSDIACAGSMPGGQVQCQEGYKTALFFFFSLFICYPYITHLFYFCLVISYFALVILYRISSFDCYLLFQCLFSTILISTNKSSALSCE